MSDTIEINGETYIKASAVNNEPKKLSNRHLFRCRNAGVHIGEIVEKNADFIKIKNANRLWRWSGAFTLSEVATKGVDRLESRIACLVPEMELVTSDICEIIPVIDGVDLTGTENE